MGTTSWSPLRVSEFRKMQTIYLSPTDSTLVLSYTNGHSRLIPLTASHTKFKFFPLGAGPAYYEKNILPAVPKVYRATSIDKPGSTCNVGPPWFWGSQCHKDLVWSLCALWPGHRTALSRGCRHPAGNCPCYLFHLNSSLLHLVKERFTVLMEGSQPPASCLELEQWMPASSSPSSNSFSSSLFWASPDSFPYQSGYAPQSYSNTISFWTLWSELA